MGLWLSWVVSERQTAFYSTSYLLESKSVCKSSADQYSISSVCCTANSNIGKIILSPTGFIFNALPFCYNPFMPTAFSPIPKTTLFNPKNNKKEYDVSWRCMAVVGVSRILDLTGGSFVNLYG